MHPRSTARLTACAAALALGVAAAGLARHSRMAHTTHPNTGKPLIVPGQDGDSTLLFNGWRIHLTGRSISTGGMRRYLRELT